MFRFSLAVAIGAVLLTAVSLHAQSRQDASASQLLQQGLSQVEAGEYEAARSTLERIDALQLEPEERVTLFETLQTIERRAGDADPPAEATEPDAGGEAAAQPEPAEPTAADMLARADAMRSNRPARAQAIYRELLASPEAEADQKKRASAGLAATRRLIDRDLTQARQWIESAAADLEAGRRDDARNQLQRIDRLDVELGWFDQQRLERLRTMVQTADEPTAVADADQPAPDDAPDAEPATMAAEDEAEAEDGSGSGNQSELEGRQLAQADTESAEPANGRAAAPAEDEAAQSDLLAEARTLYAQEKATQASQAMEEGQYARAARLYEQALRLDPDNDRYQAGLSAASAAREQGPAERGLLEGEVTSRELARQEATARYQDAMSEARELLRQEEFATALDAAARARRILDDNERVLGARYGRLRGEATNLTSTIVERQEAARAQRMAATERDRAQREAQARRQTEREEAEEVDRLLRRAIELQTEMKYDEALEVVEQALFIDGNNLAGQILKQAIEDASRAVEARQLYRERNLGVVDLQLENIRASIPTEELVEYPEVWPELTERRLAGLEDTGGDSEANNRALARLRERIPVQFDSTRLQNVIEFIRVTTGVDIFVNWPAMETVGIEQDTPITINLSAAPADEVLRLVLRQASAAVGGIEPIGFTVNEGVIRISTETDLRSETSIRQYDIRDLLVQVPNFSEAPEFDLSSALESGTGDGGGGGGGGGGGDGLFGDDDDEDDEEDAAADRQALIDSILQLIQDTVGRPEEWINLESTIRELNGNLIIKTTVDNHRDIFALLQQLRETRAIQIAVEARFLLVDENFLEDIGVDFDVFFSPELFGEGDYSIPTGIDVDQDSTDLASPSPTSLSPGQFFDIDAGSLAGSAMNFGFTAFLDDIQVDLLVNATQANRRAISLTAPRVTFFNGQRAYVLIVTQQSFISDLEPVADAAGFDVTLGVVQEGVVLDVEGTVSADRRYVTLTLRPSLAEIVDIRAIQIIGTSEIGGDGGDGDGDGTVTTFSGTIEAPELQLTEVRTTVSVPDRGTLLTGGQRIVEEVEIEAGVPVLSKIPVISRLFTNTSTVKDERTLLILVKPTVIVQSELEEENFPGLQTSPQDFNINRP
mgnify:CR=1 FL=1